jgi:hypothetical protein
MVSGNTAALSADHPATHQFGQQADLVGSNACWSCAGKLRVAALAHQTSRCRQPFFHVLHDAAHATVVLEH